MLCLFVVILFLGITSGYAVPRLCCACPWWFIHPRLCCCVFRRTWTLIPVEREHLFLNALPT